jgi:D-arabinose 1-dehydrogenase-like Zn-dependent alcohol dehydrogenase
MGTMMALRAHARGGPEQLVYEQAPAPSPRPGEVLIAVHAAAITFAELTWDLEWTTRDGKDRTPVIPSHEMSGIVADAGASIADVVGLAAGDEVIGLIDFDRDGAAAEYVVMSGANLAAKPQSLSHVAAATLPLAALTAWQALVDHAALEPGEQVLVQGAQAASAYSPSSSRRSSAATSPPPATARTPAWCGTSARNASSAPRPDVPARPRAGSTSSSTQSAVPCLTAHTACCARAAGW